jgi:hypothetical protein
MRAADTSFGFAMGATLAAVTGDVPLGFVVGAWIAAAFFRFRQRPPSPPGRAEMV